MYSYYYTEKKKQEQQWWYLTIKHVNKHPWDHEIKHNHFAEYDAVPVWQ